MSAQLHPPELCDPPDVLRRQRAWLIWKFEPQPGGGKPRKVPYYVVGGRRRGPISSASDRDRLSTYDAAKKAAAQRGFDGVGYAPLEGSGITALDFDDCITPAGLAPAVDAIIDATYAELSPSGRGVRAFVLGDLGNRKRLDSAPKVETFATNGFVTFTGRALESTRLLGLENTVGPVPDALTRLLADPSHGSKPAGLAPVNDPLAMDPPVGLDMVALRNLIAAYPSDLPYESSQGPSWLGVGMALHHETGGSDEGFDVWDDWSAKSSKYSTTEYGRARWDSFGKGDRASTTARSLLKWSKQYGARVDPAADFDVVAGAEKLDYPRVRWLAFRAGKPPAWIVKGIIPRAELVVLFGESGAGKSFVALDLAFSIARGIPWRGHRARQGAVVYVAAEGGGGLRKRLWAYETHHGVDLSTVPLDIIHAAPNLMQRTDALSLAKSIVAGGPVSVVIIDTFAQVTPGANENSAEDMGLALAHCRGIHRATGAVILLVHHAGKDTSKGARGWSGLRAAADAEIEVSRGPAGRGIRISKQKDGDDMEAWGFDLLKVPLGFDEDGDVIDSCVVVEAPLPGVNPVAARGKWERLVADVVSDFAVAQNAGIEVDQVVAEALRRAPLNENGGRDTRGQHIRRALKAMSTGDSAPYFIDGDCLEVL